MTSVRVFLVEDSEVIRVNLQAALEDLAPAVVVGTAECAFDACHRLCDLARADRCDLAIVDIFLKQGSGLDVLRCVSAHKLALTTVILTNFASSEVCKQCLALGASKVFDKSRDIEELIAFCQNFSNR